ncbi:MAG TPA: undecaprenyl-phosphate glucose phosphotransferase [Candidatus Binataceae bacterium]|nr:undecaprenyl-phosphate glucose phosphotransferase [Candidatus Binataceae bacterium]
MRKEWLAPEIVSGLTKLLDFVTIVLVGAIAFIAYLVAYLENDDNLGRYMVTALVGAVIFTAILERLDGYRFDRLSNIAWQVPRLAIAWFGSVSVLLVLAFVAKLSETYSRGWAISWAIGVAAVLVVSRTALYVAIARAKRHGNFIRSVAIVGAGDLGKTLIRKLLDVRESGMQVVGVFDDRKTRISPHDIDVPFRGTTSDLLEFARRHHVDEIIVALPLNAERRLRGIFDKLRALPADIRLSIDPLTGIFPVHGLDKVRDVPLLAVADRPLKQWSGIAKRIEDALLAGIFLALFAPAIALIALIIKLDSTGPVFFVQDRFGFNNKRIRVLKFRTMHDDQSDPSGAQRTIRNDPRVTRVGRVVRALSFDELPQLINVVKGEMSLVGPRAHAIAMMAGDRLYHEAVDTYFHRHRVKPGITGWAQVNGLRGEIDSLEKARQRVAYDLEYIERWSLWLDIKILARSAGILFERRNAY